MFNLKLLQDLNLKNADLRKQYYSFFIAGNYSSAFQLLSNHPEINDQVLKKENLNALVDAILALEGYYKTGVTDYMANQLARFQLNIDELIYLNNYSSTKQYAVNNFVMYNEGIYFCYVIPPVGTIPTNTSYWINLGLKGEKGASSLNVNYKGNWITANPYVQKDMVVYVNDLYVAKQNNTGKNPATSPNDWLLAVNVIPQVIYVSATPDQNWEIGSIWIKLLN